MSQNNATPGDFTGFVKAIKEAAVEDALAAVVDRGGAIEAARRGTIPAQVVMNGRYNDDGQFQRRWGFGQPLDGTTPLG